MLPLRLFPESGEGLEILCLGAHSDDIEIGCGGTLLRLLAERPGSSVRWRVFSAAGVRAKEARAAARRVLRGAGAAETVLHAFRDGFFPVERGPIKEVFEELKGGAAPDVIFTHARHDAHQDHRIINELTRNTFRNHLILEYEIPKYDGDLVPPNAYVPLSEAVARRKAALLLSCFKSQAGKHWFDESAFLGLMRLRGIECAAPSGFAEAFHVHKCVIG